MMSLKYTVQHVGRIWMESMKSENEVCTIIGSDDLSLMSTYLERSLVLTH